MIGDGELVGGIDLGIGRRTGLALAQLRHTVVLLRQVCQMEEARKGANDDLLLIERQTVDQIDDLTKCHGSGLAGGGHALLVDGLVGSAGTGVAGIGHNLGRQDLVEQVRDLRIILAKHTTLQAQEQRQIVAQPSGISISARRSLDSAFEPIRLTRRLTTAARRGFGYRLVA